MRQQRGAPGKLIIHIPYSAKQRRWRQGLAALRRWPEATDLVERLAIDGAGNRERS